MSDFVKFELAQKLKEKGFSLEKTEIYGKFDNDGLFHSQLYFNYIETMDCDEIIAPTISQVLEWLRKEKKLFIEISCIYTDYFPTVRLLDSRQTDYIRGDVIYSTYEQAALAGIEYSLDNLI